jgi:hypothetical protein
MLVAVSLLHYSGEMCRGGKEGGIEDLGRRRGFVSGSSLCCLFNKGSVTFKYYIFCSKYKEQKLLN